MGQNPDQFEEIIPTESKQEETSSSLETPVDNIYIATHNKAAALANQGVDCLYTEEGGQMVAEGVCEHQALDVNKRDEAVTLIKISGKTVIDGMKIKVVDEETGYEVILYTTCLDKGCPEGLTKLDRTVQLGDIELAPSMGMALYLEAQKENPGKVSLFVLKGEGELEVKVGGESIGKIIAPGLNEPLSMHSGQIDTTSEFLDSLATITPDGQVLLNTEAIGLVDSIEGFDVEAQNTVIQNDKRGDSCNLNLLLSNPSTLDPTESMLVFIALMAIIQKLKK